MPRWAWFAPLTLLVVLGALYAFRLGWLAANLTEGDAILSYAGRYVELAGPGARKSDCLAVPGQGPLVWITVICGPPGGPSWRFDVNRLGGLLSETPPGGRPGGGAGNPRLPQT